MTFRRLSAKRAANGHLAGMAAALCVGAAALACTAPMDSPEDAPRDVEALLSKHLPPVPGTPEMIVLPIEGVIVPFDANRPLDRLSPELLNAWLDLCVKRAPAAIVLDVDAPGGYAPAAQRVVDRLIEARFTDHLRIVAWVKQAGGPAAFACLACKEILARPASMLGDVSFRCVDTTGSPVPIPQPNDLQPNGATIFDDRTVAKIADVTGRPLHLLQAIRMPEREVWWRSDVGFADRQPADAPRGASAGAAPVPGDSVQAAALRTEQLDLVTRLESAQRRLDQAGGERYPAGADGGSADPATSTGTSRKSPEKMLRRERLTRERDDLRERLELNRRDLRAELAKSGRLPASADRPDRTGAPKDAATSRVSDPCSSASTYDSQRSRTTLRCECNVPYTHPDGQGLMFAVVATWSGIRLEAEPQLELVLTSDALKPVYDGATATLPLLALTMSIDSADPIKVPCAAIDTQRTEHGTTETLRFTIPRSMLERLARPAPVRLTLMGRAADLPSEFATCLSRCIDELEAHRKPVVTLDPGAVKAHEWLCLDDRSRTLSLTGGRLVETGVALAQAPDPPACREAIGLPASTPILDLRDVMASARVEWSSRVEARRKVLGPFTERLKSLRRNVLALGDAAEAAASLPPQEYLRRHKASLQRQVAACRNGVPAFPKDALLDGSSCADSVRESVATIQAAIKAASASVDANLPGKAVTGARQALQAVDALLQDPCL